MEGEIASNSLIAVSSIEHQTLSIETVDPKKIDKQDKHWTWSCFCFSVAILPLFPAMGAVGLFILSCKIWQRQYQKIIASPLNRGWGILTVLLIISSMVAEYPEEAWLGMANFIPFFWLFIAIKQLIDRPIQLKQLAWMLILPSLPVVLLGFAQLYLLWDTPPILESILGWELVPQGFPPGRMSSVFIYTNFLAIYLAIAFTLTLGMWLDTWQKKLRSHGIGNLLLLTIILLADISGLILTSSRNAWGLAVIAFMAYALYLGWRWLVWGILGAAGSILWAAFAPNFGGMQLRAIVPAFFWERLADTSYVRPVETLRITQWSFCWDLIKERPLFGWGLRNFTPLYEAKMNYWFGHPHNLFLMLGAETGIIATILLIVIVSTIAFRSIKLLINWQGNDSDKLIYFSFLIAFLACTLFNLLDVTIFDLRVNTLSWIILAAIANRYFDSMTCQD